MAAQVLLPGQLILEDRPLFVVAPEAHTEDPGVLDEVLERATARLDEEDQKTFMSLADCRVAKETEKTARGIYFTNCYTLGQSRSSPTGLLPVLSRVNHSCRPNTEFRWVEERGVEELRAATTIQEGEEITDCYLDLSLGGRVTREERQALLRGGYGFTCSCEACSLRGGEAEREDGLRREAWLLSQAQEAASVEEQLARTERLLELRMVLGFKVRLSDLACPASPQVVHLLETLETVWGLALLVGQEARAGQVAQLGREKAAVRFGGGHPVVGEWGERIRDPIKYMMG